MKSDLKGRFISLAALAGDSGLFIDGDWVESKDQDPFGDVRLIQLADVGDGTYRNRSNRFMTKEAANRLRCTFLSSGDVLIARMPDPLGRACIFPGDLKPAVTVVDVCIVRPNPMSVNTRWLMHYINNPYFRRDIERLQGGTTRKRISRKNLGQLEVFLAPKALQDDTADRIDLQFSRLEVGVAALKRAKENLKRCRASILKAACEGRLVPTEAQLAHQEGRESESAINLLKRLTSLKKVKLEQKNEEPPATGIAEQSLLPEGWLWTRLGDLGSVVRGASPRPAGDPRFFGGPIPWITVGHLTADNSPYLLAVPSGLTLEGQSRSRTVPPGTLLITNSGATLGVPKICTFEGCMNDGVAAVLDMEDRMKLYVLYYLRTRTAALRSVNQGAAQPNLNTTIIKQISIPLPPLAEQERIVAEVERRFSILDQMESAIEASLSRATRLRQSILSKAFNMGSAED